MTNQTNQEGKKPSVFKKILKVMGIAILATGAAVAAYDHRDQIASVAKKAASGIKNTAKKISDKVSR